MVVFQVPAIELSLSVSLLKHILSFIQLQHETHKNKLILLKFDEKILWFDDVYGLWTIQFNCKY